MSQSTSQSDSNWPPGYQPVWLDAAWRELGQTEVSGSNGNARIMALFRDAGHPEIRDDDVAWCAAYVGAVLARTGFTPTGSLLARSYLRWGDELNEARLGAIAIFSRGSDPGAGHVAFVIGETSHDLIVLGGNQSNGVTVTALPRSRLLGLRWPAAASVQANNRPTPKPRDTFAAALAHVVEIEGGFGNDPFDPGGPTNMGLTLADLSRFRRLTTTAENRDELVEELRNIDRAEVDAMYRALYWLPARCDALPAPIALFHFDTAVNMGVGTAARMLQTALGVTIDGEIGRETIAAAAIAGAAEVLDEYARLRRNRYRSLPTFPRFGRGWLARVDRTLARTSQPFSSPTATEEPAQMTDNHADSKIATAEQKWWGSSMTIWGAVVTGLAAVLPAIGPALGVEIPKEAVTQGAEQIGAIVQAATGLAGTLMTVFGRIRAAQPISRREFKVRL